MSDDEPRVLRPDPNRRRRITDYLANNPNVTVTSTTATVPNLTLTNLAARARVTPLHPASYIPPGDYTCSQFVYAGFLYVVIDLCSNPATNHTSMANPEPSPYARFRLQPMPGQHPAAGKAKNMRNALASFIDERKEKVD